MKVTVEYDIELSRFHDVLYELYDKSFEEKQLERLFMKLPDDVKQIAYRWGAGDTVFGDEAYVYIKEHKGTFLD